MNLLDAWTFDSGLYLANVAVAATLACASALAAVRVLKSRPAPVRYGLLLTAMLLVLLSPGVAWTARVLGFSPLCVSAPAPEEPTEAVAPMVEPAALLPTPEAPTTPAPLEPALPPPAEPAIEAAPPTEPLPWPQILVAAAALVWSAGTAVCLVFLVRGLVLVQRLRKSLRPARDARLGPAVWRAASALGLLKPPRVCASDLIPAPLSLGLARPAIVVPEGLAETLSDTDLEAVVLHEAAHIAHHDHWVGLMQRVVLALFWWNPLVRMLSDRLSAAREEVCDNYVVRAQGDGRPFAQFLVRMAGRLTTCRRLTAAIGLVQEPRRGLEERIRGLLRKEQNTMTRMNLAAMALVGAFALGLGGLMLLSTIGAAEEAGDTEAVLEEEASRATPVWVALLPRSPIRSLREYSHTLKVVDPVPEPPLYRPAPLPACDLEIRSERNPTRVMRVPYVGYFREHGEPDDSARRRMGDLRDGDYVVALCIGDAQCSNVARLRIDSAFDARKEPPLELVPLPPAPGGTLRYVGLVATGRDPVDPKFRNDTAAFPTLVVDGVERRLTSITWVGPVAPLQPGQRVFRIIDFARYKPPIAPAAEHKVTARVAQYESAPVVISPRDALGQQWDAMTGRLPSVPSPRVVLRGKVTASDGKPAVGHEVGLSNLGGARFRERCDDQGRYEFVNIPAGEYSLHANPPGKGQPIVSIKKLEIEAEKTLRQDLSLERKFSFSGKVTYDDGTPAAGHEIMASWKSPDDRAEFDDFAVVDTDGRYTLSAPFPEASYVGISATGPHPNPHRGVKAGRTDVDFVIRKKPEEGAAWGKAVEGVQVRLRPDKLKWKASETPTFLLDVRNRSYHVVRVVRHMAVNCEVEYDRQWYKWGDPLTIRAPVFQLKPGEDLPGAINIRLVRSWVGKKTGERLKLSLGKHTVRVAFIASPTVQDAEPIRAVSNAVEIEILPAEAATSTSAKAAADKPAEAEETASPPAAPEGTGTPAGDNRATSFRERREQLQIEVQKETLAETVHNLMHKVYVLNPAYATSSPHVWDRPSMERYLRQVSDNPRVAKLLKIAREGTDANRQALREAILRELRAYTNDLPDWGEEGKPWRPSVMHPGGGTSYGFLLTHCDPDASSLPVLVAIYLRRQEAARKYFKWNESSAWSRSEHGMVVAYACAHLLDQHLSRTDLRREATSEQRRALKAYEAYRNSQDTKRWTPFGAELEVMRFASDFVQAAAAGPPAVREASPPAAEPAATPPAPEGTAAAPTDGPKSVGESTENPPLTPTLSHKRNVPPGGRGGL